MPALGGALVIQSTNPARTRVAIAKIKRLLAQFNQRPGAAPAGTSDGFTLPLGAKHKLLIGLAGNRFVIAVGQKALRDAIHPSSTLGSAANYRSASGLLGQRGEAELLPGLPDRHALPGARGPRQTRASRRPSPTSTRSPRCRSAAGRGRGQGRDRARAEVTSGSRPPMSHRSGRRAARRRSGASRPAPAAPRPPAAPSVRRAPRPRARRGRGRRAPPARAPRARGRAARRGGPRAGSPRRARERRAAAHGAPARPATSARGTPSACSRAARPSSRASRPG